VLIPALRAAGASLHTVVSAAGVSSVHAARKYGFKLASTDANAAIRDPQVDAVVIATRHDAHAEQVLAALAARKHVFVEKPLCLTLEELERIAAAASASGRVLMVGFNRRFAPHVVRIRSLLAGVSGPKAFVITVNAGAIPSAHWTQDAAVGGGRLLGEGCHFIDLVCHLAAARLLSHRVASLPGARRDSATIELHFEGGSIGTIHYFANGHKSFPKERIEVFAGGRILQLDNFRRLRGFGWPAFKAMNLWRQDKGQAGCARAFVDAVRAGSGGPMPLEEIVAVSRASIEIQLAAQ
jgi:predicted dehydrogenase